MSTDNRIYCSQPPVFPVSKSSSVSVKTNSAASRSTGSFGQVLANELSGVKFSQHAIERLQSRNIQLDQSDMDKLTDAVDKAAQKGSRESLVLMNNLALVVSVKNRTVITAMDGASMKENVFTNIDSAVIV